MKLALFIDSLASGGAQRQICMLAVVLSKRNHEVTVYIYENKLFFGPLLESHGVEYVLIGSQGRLGKILGFSKILASRKPDAVVAFLSTPSIIAELASLRFRRSILVVSERGGIRKLSATDRIRYQLHRLADAVVTNSADVARQMLREAPWLRKGTTTIKNCVDLARFSYSDPPGRSGDLRLLVIGRIQPEKNPLGLLRAVEIHNRGASTRVSVDWYGDNFMVDGQPGPYSGTYCELKSQIEQKNMSMDFRLHAPVSDVAPLYADCDAVCLPSFAEGFSNVICEGMACGRPILTGDTGDNADVIDDSVSGFLFDPQEPQSIADALKKFCDLDMDKQVSMGRESRGAAERLFDSQRFADEYESLLQDKLASRRDDLGQES